MGNVLVCGSKTAGSRPALPEHSANLNTSVDSSMSPERRSMPSGNINANRDLRSVSTRSELVIGIDFGTTFTGVAYAHTAGISSVTSTTEMRMAADKVSVIKTWPNRGNYYTEKTPSILAYNKTPPIWGGNVKPADEPQISHFKLGLQDDIASHYQQPAIKETDAVSVLGGFLFHHNWRHPELPEMKAVNYAGDYLTRINQYVTKEVLPVRFGERFLQNQQISYVITVPAIWSDKAKKQTRQAALTAGINPEDLTLITEPEAAALYCATLCDEVDLEPGDRFLICDAGGGTVVRFQLLVSDILISRTLLLTKSLPCTLLESKNVL
jgi:molecular chaperone DnaK (HSP70)